MPPRHPARPSARMVRLYHALSGELGGEPPDLWEFAPPPAPLLPLQVMVWPADDELDVTTFHTLGLADRRPPGEAAEFHLAVRRYLRRAQREEVARFLAAAAAAAAGPLDGWRVLPAPGPVPQFPHCRHLLLHPPFTPAGFDAVEDPDGPVRVLYVVPVTPAERRLLAAGGPVAFAAHVAHHHTDLLADRPDPPPVDPP